MERVLSVEQMRLIEKTTMETLNISKEHLIGNAALAVVSEIRRRYYGGSVLVCIGKGNNGEDGKIIAELLEKEQSFFVTRHFVSRSSIKQLDKNYNIIVDCIFGTGLNRPIINSAKKVIEKINSSDAYIVSCDIPSGINANTGEIMGVAVKANLTVAIQEYKLGHFLGNGLDYCGQLVLKDIKMCMVENNYVYRADDSIVSCFFQPRARNVHKGNFGKTCVIGGSKNYTGSIVLSANALSAFKMGTGYANLMVPESLFEAYVGKVPECTLTSFSDSNDTIELSEQEKNKLLTYDSIAIGMGMGISKNTYKLIEFLLKNYTGKLLIDADGLNSISEYGIGILKEKKCRVIITPHIGEFSRLLKIDKDDILSDIINLSKQFALEYNLILLLKSATSIITDGDQVYLNTTGCAGMAKGGSGDVLSGFIAGLLARSDRVFGSVVCGCHLFGRAGEIATELQNEYTVTASDIIEILPNIINASIEN